MDLKLEKGEVGEKISEISARIRNIRKRKGLTQKQVAKKANVSYVTVSNLERGKVMPSSSTLLAVGKVLGVNLVKPFRK